MDNFRVIPLLHSVNDVVQRLRMAGHMPLVPRYGYGLERDNFIF
jgi:hypothetical protein